MERPTALPRVMLSGALTLPLALAAPSLLGCGTTASRSPATHTQPTATSEPNAPRSDHAFGPTWSRMSRALVGTWEAPTPRGKTITETFRFVASESALVETFGSSGHETMSVYHRDRDDVVMTHYCAQGNQPRLRATSSARPVAAAGDCLTFRYVDATNLAPGQAVLVEKSVRLDGDALEQTEIYAEPDGMRETTVLHFTRRAP